ncbi:MAG TPA: sugar phosphate isomerase/epimerase [Opitutaceae bacterium]|nr:sugar phosphate isomerase/epimerase [Opitutaceae bacterium]
MRFIFAPIQNTGRPSRGSAGIFRFVFALGLALALSSGPSICAASIDDAAAAHPAPGADSIRLGIQGYTFRESNIADALDQTRAAGVGYFEAYFKHELGYGLPGKFDHHMSRETREKILALAKAKGVRIVSYYVDYGETEADWRQIFEFARAMGMEQIATEPQPEFFDLVEQLSTEFGIRVAVHNHPSPSHYADPSVALAAVQDRGPSIGLCADTGHWARSGFDPVDCLRRAEGRILELHFKDIEKRGDVHAVDLPFGTGTSDALGQIRELQRQHFHGYLFIEYENSRASLREDVAACVKFCRDSLGQK